MKNSDKKDNGYVFFRKGTFVYVESDIYLIEFDFGLGEFGIIEIAIRLKQSVLIDWKINSKEITKGTFLKYYRVAKKHNPFVPVLEYL